MQEGNAYWRYSLRRLLNLAVAKSFTSLNLYRLYRKKKNKLKAIALLNCSNNLKFNFFNCWKEFICFCKKTRVAIEFMVRVYLSKSLKSWSSFVKERQRKKQNFSVAAEVSE